MGHARVDNLSWIVVKQVYAKGKASIADMVSQAAKKKEKVHASEGSHEYNEDNDYLFFMIIGEIIDFYLHAHKFTPQGEATPVLEPVDMTAAQEACFEEWKVNGYELWEGDAEDPESDFAQFESIKWQFAPGWRKRYPDVPIMEMFES